MDDASLKLAISKALTGPGHIPLEGPIHRSAIVALAVHCIFIENGFLTIFENANSSTLSKLLSWFGSGVKEGVYTPSKSWLSVLPSPEFVFRYQHPKSDGVFFLHCSVKEGTEQMLVRICEETQMDHVHLVGLLVSNTVPESSMQSLKQMDSWEGVFGDLELLSHNIKTHILSPLIKSIEQQFQTKKKDKSAVELWRRPWIQYSVTIILISVILGTIIHKRRNS